jgi:hypothetical protein
MMGALYAIIGLIIGGVIAIASLMGATFGQTESSGGSSFFGMMFGVGAVIFIPICYGLFGFISGLIVPTLYNILAGIVGGVEVDVQ